MLSNSYMGNPKIVPAIGSPRNSELPVAGADFPVRNRRTHPIITIRRTDSIFKVYLNPNLINYSLPFSCFAKIILPTFCLLQPFTTTPHCTFFSISSPGLLSSRKECVVKELATCMSCIPKDGTFRHIYLRKALRGIRFL